MKSERCKVGFWSVGKHQMVDIHTPPFEYGGRIPFLMGLASAYQDGEIKPPSSIVVVWTPDDLSIWSLDAELCDIPKTVLDAIELDVRQRGFKFQSPSDFSVTDVSLSRQ